MPKYNKWVAEIVYWASLTIISVMSFYTIGLLAIALMAPERWPGGLVNSTALPGYILPTATLYGRLMHCMQNFFAIGTVAMVLIPLAGILRSVSRGNPFNKSNVVRLRTIAAAYAIVTIAPLVLPAKITIVLMMMPSSFSYNGALMTIILIVLAEVFRDGVRLRQDVDGTI